MRRNLFEPQKIIKSCSIHRMGLGESKTVLHDLWLPDMNNAFVVSNNEFKGVKVSALFEIGEGK